MKKNKNIPLNLREQMNSRIGLTCSVILLVLLVIAFRQLDYNLIEKPKIEAQKAAEEKKAAAKKAAEKPEISTASVIAVGDNLYHGSLIESGENDSGTWNYDKIYEKVTDEIQAADVAMVDQETVFTTEHDAVSSYPSFATPTEVGDALIKRASMSLNPQPTTSMITALISWKKPLTSGAPTIRTFRFSAFILQRKMPITSKLLK